MQQVCPYCGTPVSSEDEECPYCHIRLRLGDPRSIPKILKDPSFFPPPGSPPSREFPEDQQIDFDIPSSFDPDPLRKKKTRQFF